jgi:hypothetical protein
MSRVSSWLIVSTAVIIGVAIGSSALSSQDKYTVKVPNGLAFSEFRGYEAWQTVAVSQNGDLIEVIVGNPAMISAYQTGLPAAGRHFPDGVKMAKIHWKATKSEDEPGTPTIPGALDDVDFMVKDSKRFADSGGWGYAQFNYDVASDSFSPLGSDAKCGFACHTIVAAKDYVFTHYGKR